MGMGAPTLSSFPSPGGPTAGPARSTGRWQDPGTPDSREGTVCVTAVVATGSNYGVLAAPSCLASALESKTVWHVSCIQYSRQGDKGRINPNGSCCPPAVPRFAASSPGRWLASLSLSLQPQSVPNGHHPRSPFQTPAPLPCLRQCGSEEPAQTRPSPKARWGPPSRVRGGVGRVGSHLVAGLVHAGRGPLPQQVIRVPQVVDGALHVPLPAGRPPSALKSTLVSRAAPDPGWTLGTRPVAMPETTLLRGSTQSLRRPGGRGRNGKHRKIK